MGRRSGLTLEINNFQDWQRTMRDVRRIMQDIDKTLKESAQQFDKWEGFFTASSKGAADASKALKEFQQETKSTLKTVEKDAEQSGKKTAAAISSGLKDAGDAVEKEVVRPWRSRLNELPTIMRGVGQASGQAFQTGVKAANFAAIGVQAARDFSQSFAQNIQDIGKSIQQSGRNLVGSGVRTLAAGGIAGFLGGQTVSMAADFEQVMNQIRVFGGLVGDELTNVQNEILKFSAETIFAPQQSADAFLDLQKAGLSVAESMAVMSDVGDLAASGQLSLAESTNYVIQTMQVFGLGIEDSTRIANAYVQAANLSTASVTDLGAGMANVGTLAREFGLDFEDAIAILAMFNDAGIKGSEAGTQLKSMLTNMTRPTKEVRDAFAELGVSLTDAQGNFRELNDIIDDMDRSMNETRTVTVDVVRGMSEEQEALMENATDAWARTNRQITLAEQGLAQVSETTLNRNREIRARAEQVMGELSGSVEVVGQITRDITRTQAENFETLNIIAGTYGQAGLAVLLSQDEAAITSFVEEMGGLPTAAQLSEEMMSTFKGTLDSFKGSLQTLLIRGLIPVMQKGLQPLLEEGIEVINAIADLPEPVLAGAAAAVTLTTALVTLSGAGMILTGLVMQPLGFAVAGVGTAMTAVVGILFNPIGLIAGVISLTGGLIGLAAIATGIGALFLGGFAIASQIINDVKNNVGGAGDAFNEFTGGIKEFFDALIELGDSVIDVVGDIGGAFFGARDSADRSTSGIAGFFDRVTDKLSVVKSMIQEISQFLDFIGIALGNAPAPAGLDQNIQSLQAQRRQLEMLREEGAAVQQQSSTVQIQPGDNLTRIAKREGVTVDELIDWNDIQNPNLIRSGDSLVVRVGVEADDSEFQSSIDAQIEEIDKQLKEKRSQLGAQDAADTLLEDIPENTIFQQIFGEDPNTAIAEIREVKGTIGELRTDVDGIVDGFLELASGDVTGGIETLSENFGSLTQSASKLFEQITGISPADAIRDIFTSIQDAVGAGGSDPVFLGGGTIGFTEPGTLTQIGTLLKDNLETPINNLIDAAERLKESATGAFDEFLGAFSDEDVENLKAIGEVIGKVTGVAVFIGLNFLGYGIDIVATAFDALGASGEVIAGFLEFVVGIGELDTEKIGSGLLRMGRGLVNVGEALFGFPMAIATFLGNLVGLDVRTRLDAFATSFSQWGDQLTLIFQFIENAANQGLTDIQLTIADKINSISETLQSITNIDLSAFGIDFEGIDLGTIDTSDLEERSQLLQKQLELLQSTGNYVNLDEIGAMTAEGAGRGDQFGDPESIQAYRDAFQRAIDEQAPDTGRGFLEGVQEGVSETEALNTAVSDAAQGMIDAMHETLQIQSPSGVGAEIGASYIQGIMQGITSNIPLLSIATTGMTSLIDSLLTTTQRVTFGITLSFMMMSIQIIPAVMLFTNQMNITRNSIEEVGNAANETNRHVTGLITSINALQALRSSFSNLSIPGRAEGGSIGAGGIYEILEPQTGGFEMLFSGGQTFLLSGRNGFIEPMNAVQGVPSGSPMGGGMQYTLNFNPTISVGENAGVTPAQVQGMLDSLRSDLTTIEPPEITRARKGY